MSLRVLVVAAAWDLCGGSERYAGAAAEALAARGHEVRVLCGAAGAAPGRAERVDVIPGLAAASPSAAARAGIAAAAAGADVALAVSNLPSWSFEALTDALPVVRFVQDHVLVCPGSNKMLRDGSPCERPLGRACLRSYWLGPGCSGFHRERHGTLLAEPLGELRKARAGLRVARRAKRLLVASEYMRGELLRAGVKPAEIEVLPYFTRSATATIPPAPLPAEVEAFLAAGAEPLILACARFAHPDKGIDHLLTALTKVRAPFRAVLAGDGPAADWLRAKARGEGLAERVCFPGWLPPGALETLYSRARCLAFPSIWNEPFGLAALEAMAHALPVVAFDGGAVREWAIHEETALLAPRRDTDTLAAHLERLLVDEDLANRLGTTARARAADRFSEPAHAARLERILAVAAR